MKITFKMIDGKPVPHVWTMPESYNEKDYSGDQWKERAGLYAYNKVITHARENAVPVKEDFIWQVEKIIRKQYWNELNILPLQKFESDLTRDYDVGMEFEIEEMETNETIFSDGGGWRVKVAIPKQTKEIEYKAPTNFENVRAIEPIKEEKEQILHTASLDYMEKQETNYPISEAYKSMIKGQIAYAFRDGYKFKLENQPTKSGEGKTVCAKCGGKGYWTYFSTNEKVKCDCQSLDNESVLEGYQKQIDELNHQNRVAALKWLDELIELQERIKHLESVAPTDEEQEKLIREIISEWNKLPGEPGCMERVKSKFRISRI